MFQNRQLKPDRPKGGRGESAPVNLRPDDRVEATRGDKNFRSNRREF